MSLIAQTITLNVAANRLTDRLRQQSFEAMLKQDLAFFDEPENAVSVLINRLTVDASEVNQVRPSLLYAKVPIQHLCIHSSVHPLMYILLHPFINLTIQSWIL